MRHSGKEKAKKKLAFKTQTSPNLSHAPNSEEEEHANIVHFLRGEEVS